MSEPLRWQVESCTDSMTDAVTHLAKGTSLDGHQLTISNREDGTIWAGFEIPQGGGTLSQSPPIYRVDKLEVSKLESVRDLESLMANLGEPQQLLVMEPKAVQWRIYAGPRALARASDLSKLMTGRSLVFRYFLVSGSFHEVTFSLDGAQSAIELACQVKLL
jgi:hypothetical protein